MYTYVSTHVGGACPLVWLTLVSMPWPTAHGVCWYERLQHCPHCHVRMHQPLGWFYRTLHPSRTRLGKFSENHVREFPLVDGKSIYRYCRRPRDDCQISQNLCLCKILPAQFNEFQYANRDCYNFDSIKFWRYGHDNDLYDLFLITMLYDTIFYIYRLFWELILTSKILNLEN